MITNLFFALFLSALGGVLGRFLKSYLDRAMTWSLADLAIGVLGGFWGFVIMLMLTMITEWKIDHVSGVTAVFFVTGAIGGFFVNINQKS